MFLTKSVIAITEFLNSNQFQYQWISKLKESTDMKQPINKGFVIKKKRHRPDFFVKRLRRRQNLSKKMRRRQDFFDWILMGTLSSWCSM